MSFLTDWAAKPTAGGGNYIKDGKGKFIIKDVRVESTYKDKRTFIVELYVKESSSVETDSEGKPVPPNAVGSSASYVQMLTKFESAPANAKAAIIAILGPEAEALDAEKLAAEMAELMRLDATGYTKKGSECPVRGCELAYETHRKPTRDGSKTLTLPRFAHVAFDEKTVAANRRILDGAAASSAA